MNAYYDKIARQYQKSKTLPFRQYVEWYSYSKFLNDVTGKSVLDLACGDGFYSRRIKDKGAGRVVGVDISSKMIDLARQKNTWEKIEVDPEGVRKFGHDFWQDFLVYEPIIGIVSKR